MIKLPTRLQPEAYASDSCLTPDEVAAGQTLLATVRASFAHSGSVEVKFFLGRRVKGGGSAYVTSLTPEVTVTMGLERDAETGDVVGIWGLRLEHRFWCDQAPKLAARISKAGIKAADVGHEFTGPEDFARAAGAKIVTEGHRLPGGEHLSAWIYVETA